MHHLYKSIELVGTSPQSFDDAVKTAVARARRTLRNLQWFEVVEERGNIGGPEIEFQVKVRVWFALEEDESAG
jgi:dodecin